MKHPAIIKQLEAIEYSGRRYKYTSFKKLRDKLQLTFTDYASDPLLKLVRNTPYTITVASRYVVNRRYVWIWHTTPNNNVGQN